MSCSCSSRLLSADTLGRTYNGLKIENGDVVTKIDGAPVTKSDVAAQLRGRDIPGEIVTVSIIKAHSDREVDFKLTKADMRSVLHYKDLFLTLGELNSENSMIKSEKVSKKIVELENRVNNIMEFHSLQDSSHHAHVEELEQLVREVSVSNQEIANKCANLEATLKALEREKESTGRDFESMKGAEQDLQRRLRELERERDETKRQLDGARVANNNLQWTEKQLESCRSEVETLTAANNNLSEQLRACKESEKSSEAERTRSRQDFSMLSQLVEDLKKQIDVISCLLARAQR